MTLKQKMFLKKLPEEGYNMAEAMRQAGYKEGSIRSGEQYKSCRKLTQRLDFFDEEKIKKDIALTFLYAKREKDITNMARINEHRSKIAGMITDKSEVKQDTTLKVEEQKDLLQRFAIQ